MKTEMKLLVCFLSSFLTACGALGDYVSPYEIAPVSKSETGLCFHIERAEDYYVNYLSIRKRHSPEMSGFNRLLPALTIKNNQICIPETYYKFSENGEINVDIALRSPTRMMERRNVMSEFTLINGVPFPFHPRDYSVPIPDAEDYQ